MDKLSNINGYSITNPLLYWKSLLYMARERPTLNPEIVSEDSIVTLPGIKTERPMFFYYDSIEPSKDNYIDLSTKKIIPRPQVIFRLCKLGNVRSAPVGFLDEPEDLHYGSSSTIEYFCDPFLARGTISYSLPLCGRVITDVDQDGIPQRDRIKITYPNENNERLPVFEPRRADSEMPDKVQDIFKRGLAYLHFILDGVGIKGIRIV